MHSISWCIFTYAAAAGDIQNTWSSKLHILTSNCMHGSLFPALEWTIVTVALVLDESETNFFHI